MPDFSMSVYCIWYIKSCGPIGTPGLWLVVVVQGKHRCGWYTHERTCIHMHAIATYEPYIVSPAQGSKCYIFWRKCKLVLFTMFSSAVCLFVGRIAWKVMNVQYIQILTVNLLMPRNKTAEWSNMAAVPLVGHQQCCARQRIPGLGEEGWL